MRDELLDQGIRHQTIEYYIYVVLVYELASFMHFFSVFELYILFQWFVHGMLIMKCGSNIS